MWPGPVLPFWPLACHPALPRLAPLSLSWSLLGTLLPPLFTISSPPGHLLILQRTARPWCLQRGPQTRPHLLLFPHKPCCCIKRGKVEPDSSLCSESLTDGLPAQRGALGGDRVRPLVWSQRQAELCPEEETGQDLLRCGWGLAGLTVVAGYTLEVCQDWWRKRPYVAVCCVVMAFSILFMQQFGKMPGFNRYQISIRKGDFPAEWLTLLSLNIEWEKFPKKKKIC